MLQNNSAACTSLQQLQTDKTSLKTLISLTFITMLSCSTAQDHNSVDLTEKYANGSGILLNPVKDQQLKDLVLLGKVWGFLKYYHPEVAKGTFNWDYELFQILSAFQETQQKDHNALLIAWLDKLGEVTNCATCRELDPEAYLHPDHSWINELDNEVSKRLQVILKSEPPSTHHYVSFPSRGGNPNLTNELSYEHMPYPDEGYRLLSLFRYWNIIEYFSPYKYLTHKNWDDVLEEYITVFLGAKDELAYELSIMKFMTEIGDSHGWTIEGDERYVEWLGRYVPPIHVRFVEGQLVVTDFYKDEFKATIDLSLGTVITHINGRLVADIVKEKMPYYPASNKGALMRDMAPDMLKSNDKEITLTIKEDSGNSRKLKLQLFEKGKFKRYGSYPPVEGPSYRWLEDSIGYVTLQNITEDDVWELRKTFKEAKGIIVDIRNYPSTYVGFDLGAFFIKKTRTFSKFTSGSVSIPGQFTFTDPTKLYYTTQPYKKGKVVVLVNEFTQSMAEYTTMAFKAGHNTTIMGNNTAGADGNVSKFFLPGGVKLLYSGIGVYYPDGTPTQRIGIVPDIVVRPTIQGIREGRDEELEAAIQFLQKE
ncbi:MAG: S41 family peptidase [Cytophagales bacterium]|nr:S41 family peptidase [Cytophagales bacterium]